MNPGTDPLARLHDIHLPAPPGFWPPAPGWWVVAALGLALLLFIGVRVYRRYRIRRQRQRLLGQLQALPERYPGDRAPELAAEVSMLLRRLALRRFGRERVANLTGTHWLHFLDETGGNGRFVEGPGQVLASGPYAPQLELDSGALLDLAGDWIRANTGDRLK